jgi:hypothetical protein
VTVPAPSYYPGIIQVARLLAPHETFEVARAAGLAQLAQRIDLGEQGCGRRDGLRWRDGRTTARRHGLKGLKEECVWLHNFGSFTEARAAITKWIQWYNAGRPHQALGYRSPR